MGFIHSTNVCQKEVITFSWLWEEEEDGNNWRSSSHHSKKIPQAMRNMKNLILEEPLIHLSIWIINDVVSEWRRRWSWRLKKESTHETNKDEYSIVISWYCLVMHLFIFSWCVMYVWVFTFILLNSTLGMKSMLLYYILLLLIYIEIYLLEY